jgi:hypothetical protein
MGLRRRRDRIHSFCRRWRGCRSSAGQRTAPPALSCPVSPTTPSANQLTCGVIDANTNPPSSHIWHCTAITSKRACATQPPACVCAYRKDSNDPYSTQCTVQGIWTSAMPSHATLLFPSARHSRAAKTLATATPATLALRLAHQQIADSEKRLHLHTAEGIDEGNWRGREGKREREGEGEGKGRRDLEVLGLVLGDGVHGHADDVLHIVDLQVRFDVRRSLLRRAAPGAAGARPRCRPHTATPRVTSSPLPRTSPTRSIGSAVCCCLWSVVVCVVTGWLQRTCPALCFDLLPLSRTAVSVLWHLTIALALKRSSEA